MNISEEKNVRKGPISSHDFCPLYPFCHGGKEKATTGAALERVVVWEGLSFELPPEDHDPHEARAEEEKCGGFWDGGGAF